MKKKNIFCLKLKGNSPQLLHLDSNPPNQILDLDLYSCNYMLPNIPYLCYNPSAIRILGLSYRSWRVRFSYFCGIINKIAKLPVPELQGEPEEISKEKARLAATQVLNST